MECASATIDEAVKIAKEVDYVALIMGLDQTQERESHDRVHLELPGKQQELLTNVARAAKKPVVLFSFLDVQLIYLQPRMTKPLVASCGLVIPVKLEELPLQILALANTIQVDIYFIIYAFTN